MSLPQLDWKIFKLVRGPCSSGSKVKSTSHIWGVQRGYLDEMTESYSSEHHANLLFQ